jgi:hypothetical protein
VIPTSGRTTSIGRCYDRQKFTVLPERWNIARTVGRIGRQRRLVWDFEPPYSMAILKFHFLHY